MKTRVTHGLLMLVLVAQAAPTAGTETPRYRMRKDASWSTSLVRLTDTREDWRRTGVHEWVRMQETERLDTRAKVIEVHASGAFVARMVITRYVYVYASWVHNALNKPGIRPDSRKQWTFARLIRRPFTARFGPRGRLVAVEGLEPVLKHVRDRREVRRQNTSLLTLLSADHMKSLLAGSWIQLSGDVVSAWSFPWTGIRHPYGDLEIVLRGTRRANGKGHLSLRVVSAHPRRSGGQIQTMRGVDDVKNRGSCRTDSATGVPTKGRLKMTFRYAGRHYSQRFEGVQRFEQAFSRTLR